MNDYDLPEGYVEELGCTVRTCLGCGSLVSGGPTRCIRCVKQGEPKRTLVKYIKDQLRKLFKVRL